MSAAPSRVWRGLPLAAMPLQLRGVARSARDPEPDAQDEARAARQRAFDEAARAGREQGLRSGYEEGLQRGTAEAAQRQQQAAEHAVADAMARLDAQRAQLAGLAAALERTIPDALAAAEDEMVALSFEALCRVLASEAVRPEVVVAHVRQLVARGRSGVLSVHVHPDDLALLRQADSTSPGDAASTQWVADPEVATAGCVLRLRAGALDARLETALQACKKALLNARAERTRAVAPTRSPS